MTERAWVLQSDSGNFYKGEGYMCEYINNAWSGGSSKHAQRVAQFARQNYGRGVPFLYAIPIEREIVRKVEGINLPTAFVLRRGDEYVRQDNEEHKTTNIEQATVFRSGNVPLSAIYGTCTLSPVRVTEEPGEWKVVEE